MAAPIVSGSLDNQAPTIGQVLTLTVNYSDPDATTNTITITGTDAEGHPGTATVTYTVGDPVTLAVADSSGRVWSKISDTGAIAVYRTTV
jgi:hypothetical protein